nr:ubiquitin thioesterase otulin isoform X2 [Petromyzon marinus]XP_032823313.1 ubiquitin thioesterase otulin isoform X2 [Petromyzon marinus]
MASVDENSSLGGKVGARKTFDSSEVDLKSEVIPPNVVGDLSDTAVSNNHSDRLSIACKDCGTEEEQGDLTPKNSRQQCLLTESKSYVNSNENIASGSQPEESDLKEDAGTHDLSTENRAEAGGEPEMGQSFTGCIASKGFGDNFEKIHQSGEREIGKKGGKGELHPLGNAAKVPKDLDPQEDSLKKRERQHLSERWKDTAGRPQHGGGNRPHTDDQGESCGLVQSLSHQEEDMYRSEGTIDKMPIGERRELVDYSCREWKGSTAKTKKIKKAYLELSGKGYFDIRRVRGDNYCGLRATLFQAFWKKIYIFDSTVKITELPHVLYQRNKGLIENWTFANREVKGRCNQASLVICLQNLENEWLKACTFEAANAENFCKDLFNQLGVTEWRLYEAVKLLMLWKAVDLYEMQQRGEDVPLFATLMFARETSLKPLSFLINHLNHVGSSGGLEQVEMCLLGYTLGITIRAFRLYMFGTEEFQVCYPESEPARGGGAVERPEVAIVTEDDRHYNVLLPSPNQPPCGHGEQPPLGHSKQRARSPHAL